MRLVFVATFACLFLASPSRVDACGGFFCGNTPVDQQAERVLFAVSDAGTDMIVQISYRGAAEEFAWVLPVPDVPDAASLDTFPAQALSALDANTSPIFLRPMDDTCSPVLLNGGGPDSSTPGVTVFIEQTVGPFEVAVLEGDAAPVVSWLQERAFRISESMVPLLQEYADAGMKLVALKLSADADTEDIEPIRMRFPPGPVSIPLRITAIAAEPEMGLLVFLLADQRWGPDNWAELDIDPATLRFAAHAWPVETDWLRRVALEADAFGGKAFVTELAEPTTRLVEQLRVTMPADPDQRAAAEALLDLLEDYPYLTRLYSRLSPNEMDVDPVFAPHDGPDVARERQMARFVAGVDQCTDPDLNPCLYATCGAGALCTPIQSHTGPLAGCHCPEGTLARTTFTPTGVATVVCVQEGSFLEPGEGEDPCAGFDCGLGECVANNMTPTCRCNEGGIAVGWELDGQRHTRCVTADEVIPRDLILGPLEPTPDPEPARDAFSGGGCSAGGTGGGLLLLLGLVVLRRRRA